MEWKESVRYLTQIGGFDDWGVFLWMTSMFRIIPAQIFLNFSYCILGTVSAVMLYNIGANIMPRRYAYIAALSFSISSYTILYHSQCLKETIMAFLIVASFNSFYSFLRRKKIQSILFALLYSILLLFFRVPVSLFLILSFGLTLILMYSRKILFPVLGALILVIIYFSPFFLRYTYDRYMSGGDIEAIIERKVAISGGGIINQAVDPLAAIIGPFPSIAMNSVSSKPLSASGLIYRVLLSFPFLLGTIYAFRYKCQKIYPLIFFFFANAIGLAISVKGLELRLSYPHLSIMYLVAFWWLANYDYHRIKQKIPNILIYGCFVVVLIICLVWNLRLS